MGDRTGSDTSTLNRPHAIPLSDTGRKRASSAGQRVDESSRLLNHTLSG